MGGQCSREETTLDQGASTVDDVPDSTQRVEYRHTRTIAASIKHAHKHTLTLARFAAYDYTTSRSSNTRTRTTVNHDYTVL